MRRVCQIAILSFCLLGAFQVSMAPVFAATPPAAEGGEGPTVSHELIFDTINFVLLVGLLVYLYRKRGRAFFDERSQEIRESLEDGRITLEKAQARLADAEKKLAGLQDEVRALRKQAEAEIDEEQARMRAAADEEARRIEEFAKVRIQAATNAAKLELKDYLVQEALDQAREMIRQRMDGQNRQRLVSFFLDDLSSKTKSN